MWVDFHSCWALWWLNTGIFAIWIVLGIPGLSSHNLFDDSMAPFGYLFVNPQLRSRSNALGFSHPTARLCKTSTVAIPWAKSTANTLDVLADFTDAHKDFAHTLGWRVTSPYAPPAYVSSLRYGLTPLSQKRWVFNALPLCGKSGLAHFPVAVVTWK